MKRSAAKMLFLLLSPLVFTACLSTEVTLDLRERSALVGEFVYTIPRQVWDLGVFDSASPERAVPVSERDARETAGLYQDVDLASYSVHEGDDEVVVRARYQAGSLQSLRGLLGGDGTLRLDEANRTMRISLSEGLQTIESAQEALVRDLFRDRVFALTVISDLELSLRTAPDYGSLSTSADDHYTWQCALSDLLLDPSEALLVFTWE